MTAIVIDMSTPNTVVSLSASDKNAFSNMLAGIVNTYTKHHEDKLIHSLLSEMAASSTPSVVLNKYMAVYGISKIIRVLFAEFVEYAKTLARHDNAKAPNGTHILQAMRKYDVVGDLKTANALARSVLFR